MGCCVSSNNNNKSNSSQQGDQEEETVKEVLSETPTILQKPTNYTATQNDHFKICHNNMDEEKHIFKKPIMGFTHQNDHHHSGELSDLSGTTIGVGSDPDPDGPPEVRQRSPANHRRNSPTRRSVPSPGRVRTGHGPGSGRDLRGGRRDNGECSGRRSRSPGMRAENGGYGSGLGRSPSVRKMGNSPGRVRSEMGDRVRKMEEVHGKGENKCPPTSGNESLENPLVSLECFIFL